MLPWVCPGGFGVSPGVVLEAAWTQIFPFRPLRSCVAHPEWFPVVLRRVKSLNNEVFHSGCFADLLPSIRLLFLHPSQPRCRIIISKPDVQFSE